MNRLVVAGWCAIAGMLRPSPRANARRLRARGESLADVVLREATESDIPAIARLHVDQWNATYAPFLEKGPSVAVRDRQWREALAKAEATGWFCWVAVRHDGTIVGFAQANRSDDPAFAGELRKIYLRTDYQRLGLGRRLVGHVARRFLAQGITSMWLFGDARNPSQRAWHRLGAQKRDADHDSGNYGWHDIRPLAALADRPAP